MYSRNKVGQSQDRFLRNSAEDMTDRRSTGSKSHMLDVISEVYDRNQDNA
jgi:hypothetical protein